MLQIGSLRLDNGLLLAPMAGITNRAFRLVVKRQKPGPALVATEMVSAVGILREHKRTWDYLKTHSDEAPLAVQLFGADPAALSEAASRVARAGAHVVDLNMGCPVRKVVRAGAGAALLRDPAKIQAILSAVRERCPVPLTVKMRAGWSPQESSVKQLAALMEAGGADAITVHGRYAVQGFDGQADWNLISQAKEAVGIPVIGNGDVRDPAAALAMKRQTGCDGVMIGRGAIGNPWIFQQIYAVTAGRDPLPPSLQQRRELLAAHFDLLSADLGSHRAGRIMRGLLLWYSKGLPHSTHFRAAVTRIQDLGTLNQVLGEYFADLERRGF